MSAVGDAAASLLAAVKTVPNTRQYRDPGAAVDPPGIVLGPPALAWEGMCSGPTSATFLVYVVVAADERYLEQLWELVPLVADALDSVPDATVTGAVPGAYQSGGSELPCYEITVEVSLR